MSPSSALIITWMQLLYISVVVVIFYVAHVCFFFYKQKKIQQSNLYEEQRSQISTLKKEMELVKIRLSAILVSPQENQPLTKKIDEFAESPDAEDSLYAQAIRMAQSGASAHKLVDECGLSRAEADLIVAIYHGVYKG